mgnify:CR=1 FL=1
MLGAQGCLAGGSAVSLAGTYADDFPAETDPVQLQWTLSDGQTGSAAATFADGFVLDVFSVSRDPTEGDSERYEERIREGGCEGYISKPITVAGFFETVGRFLDP